jgi:hypothetical protein
VFAERLPDFIEPWVRTTIRFCQQITSIGLSTCGKGGAKLAARLGIQTSRQTLLRRIMDLPDVLTGSVLFLGRDDFSFRHGYCFGTILMNLESRRVVDLLADREAETSAQWMRHHPDIPEASTNRVRVMWLAVMLALFTALSYLLIQLGVLGVGDLQPTEGPAAIVYVAAGGYLLGGLLILVRRRWLWIVGAVINALVILFFFTAYQHRPAVMFSPGGLVTKVAQLLLEASLLYLIITDWMRSHQRVG